MPPFTLFGVWRDGVPMDLQEYMDLDSALDERDRRRLESGPSVAPFYGVADEDNPERGWLEWETFV